MSTKEEKSMIVGEAGKRKEKGSVRIWQRNATVLQVELIDKRAQDNGCSSSLKTIVPHGMNWGRIVESVQVRLCLQGYSLLTRSDAHPLTVASPRRPVQFVGRRV